MEYSNIMEYMYNGIKERGPDSDPEAEPRPGDRLNCRDSYHGTEPLAATLQPATTITTEGRGGGGLESFTHPVDDVQPGSECKVLRDMGWKWGKRNKGPICTHKNYPFLPDPLYPAPYRTTTAWKDW